MNSDPPPQINPLDAAKIMKEGSQTSWLLENTPKDQFVKIRSKNSFITTFFIQNHSKTQ